MSSKYKFLDGSTTTTLYANAAGDTYYKLMYDSTFTLQDIGYTGGSKEYLNAKIPSGYDHICGGFWGIPLTTPYYCDGSNSALSTPSGSGRTMIPFVDIDSCPIPSMLALDNVTYERIFPTAANTTNIFGTSCYYHTLAGITAGTNVTISYSGGNLVVKMGSTTWLSTAAQPYILLDIQAPGGNGGSGAYAENNAWLDRNDKVGVAGGGGGGSGSYLYLSAKANSGTITITVNSDHYKVKSSGSSDYIKMYKGGNGGNASASNSPSASGGSAGSGGAINMYNSSGTLLWYDTQMMEEVLGNFCVLAAYRGGAGGRGSSATATGSLAASKAGTTGGYAVDSLWLTNHPYAEGVGCGGTSGTGEQSSGCTAFAGGGGGAASVVGSGASHGGSAGEGAGGYGESGWTGMSSSGGGAGGNGAIRIYYRAT